MTKRFEFNWQIPVPEQLLKGCYFERWTEEKENVDYEAKCLFRVDEYGFFIYWKSEGRVSTHICIFTMADGMEFCLLCNSLAHTDSLHTCLLHKHIADIHFIFY